MRIALLTLVCLTLAAPALGQGVPRGKIIGQVEEGREKANERNQGVDDASGEKGKDDKGKDKGKDSAGKPGENKPGDAKPAAPMTAEKATSLLDFTVKNIDGADVPLSNYRGKVLLVVNVASKCGFTKQYEQLELLHEKYAEKGLAVLAFPANNFMGQEPGSNEEIKSFCHNTYGVKFDMFAKVSVKGADMCEPYKFLTSKEKNGEFGGEIGWNFTKFVIDRSGKVVARFDSKTRPDAPEVTKRSKSALAEKSPTEKAAP